MQERTYICKDEACETWFTIHGGIWSAESLVCPLCQGAVVRETERE